MDAEHGLINMRGREYDPVLGQFLQLDPIVQAPFYAQSLNRFSYVWNNPLKLVDPSGFSPIATSPLKELTRSHGGVKASHTSSGYRLKVAA